MGEENGGYQVAGYGWIYVDKRRRCGVKEVCSRVCGWRRWPGCGAGLSDGLSSAGLLVGKGPLALPSAGRWLPMRCRPRRLL